MVTHHQRQSDEELCLLVVREVIHLVQLVLRGLVQVLGRQDQKVWDAVHGLLRQGLDDLKILGEGHELGLSLGKPAADPFF